MVLKRVVPFREDTEVLPYAVATGVIVGVDLCVDPFSAGASPRPTVLMLVCVNVRGTALEAVPYEVGIRFVRAVAPCATPYLFTLHCPCALRCWYKQSLPLRGEGVTEGDG